MARIELFQARDEVKLEGRERPVISRQYDVLNAQRRPVEVHRLDDVGVRVVRGAAIDERKPELAAGVLVGSKSFGGQHYDVVLNYKTLRKELAPAGLYRPVEHGSHAVAAAIAPLADQMHVKLQERVARLALKDAVRARELQGQANKLYDKAQTPEEQLLLMRKLVASEGSVEEVLSYQDRMHRELGDKISDAREVLKYGVGAGHRDGIGKACAQVALDRMALRRDPAVKVRLDMLGTEGRLRAQLASVAKGVPTVAQGLDRLNSRFGKSEKPWRPVAIDTSRAQSRRVGFETIVAHVNSATEGDAQVFVGNDEHAHALLVEAHRTDAHGRSVFSVFDPADKDGASRDMTEQDLVNRGLFGMAQKTGVGTALPVMGAKQLKRKLAGIDVTAKPRAEVVQFPRGIVEKNVIRLAGGDFVAFFAGGEMVKLRSNGEVEWRQQVKSGKFLVPLADGGFATGGGNLVTIWNADGEERHHSVRPADIGAMYPLTDNEFMVVQKTIPYRWRADGTFAPVKDAGARNLFADDEGEWLVGTSGDAIYEKNGNGRDNTAGGAHGVVTLGQGRLAQISGTSVKIVQAGEKGNNTVIATLPLDTTRIVQLTKDTFVAVGKDNERFSVHDRDGKQLSFFRPKEPVSHVVSGGNGRLLLIHDSQVKVLDFDTAAEPSVLTVHQAGPSGQTSNDIAAVGAMLDRVENAPPPRGTLPGWNADAVLERPRVEEPPPATLPETPQAPVTQHVAATESPAKNENDTTRESLIDLSDPPNKIPVTSFASSHHVTKRAPAPTPVAPAHFANLIETDGAPSKIVRPLAPHPVQVPVQPRASAPTPEKEDESKKGDDSATRFSLLELN